jgi:hypothetical protein
VDSSSTVVSSTVAGEWLQYTRNFAAGRYDVYLNAAYKSNVAATLGLDFYSPGTTVAIAGKGACYKF